MFTTTLISFSNLVIPGLYQIASHTSATAQVPDTYHQVTVNSIHNKLNTINDKSNQSWIQTCEDTSVELFATWDSVFDAAVYESGL